MLLDQGQLCIVEVFSHIGDNTGNDGSGDTKPFSRLQLRGQSWMPSRRGVWGTCSSRLVMATKGAVDDRWWRELECSWLGWG